MCHGVSHTYCWFYCIHIPPMHIPPSIKMVPPPTYNRNRVDISLQWEHLYPSKVVVWTLTTNILPVIDRSNWAFQQLGSLSPVCMLGINDLSDFWNGNKTSGNVHTRTLPCLTSMSLSLLYLEQLIKTCLPDCRFIGVMHTCITAASLQKVCLLYQSCPTLESS